MIVGSTGRFPVLIPLLTALVESVRVSNGCGYLALPLEKLDAETLGSMPSDVTMHDPKRESVSILLRVQKIRNFWWLEQIRGEEWEHVLTAKRLAIHILVLD